MRKLAIICFSFSAAVFCSNYILPLSFLPVVAALVLILAVYFIIRPAKFLRPVILSLLSLAFGFGLFFAHAQFTAVKAEKFVGDTVDIEARLLTYPIVYDDYCRAEIEFSSKKLPGFRALLYDNSMSISEAKPGDRLSFTGKLSSAGTKYGEPYDNYYSKDIYLIVNSRSEIKTQSHFDPRNLPQIINRKMTEHIDYVFPGETAAFAKSLMLGEKSDLYEVPGQYNDLSRAGLAHIVAVSGMHIGYLVTLLHFLFGKSRKSSLLAIALAWCFVFISGASPSAVRAGIMQTVFLMAPVFKRENDSATTISFALAIILLFNPYAAASISLQLSFAAMAGIMIFASRFSGTLSSLMPSKLRPIAISAGTSAAATLFIVPLVAIHFEIVNVLSVVSAVLTLWAVSYCFCGAYIACFAALISFKLGAAFAWLVSWLIRYILLVADFISSIPFSAVYLNTAANIIWLILCYVLIIICAISRMRIVYKVILPISLSALMLAASSLIIHSYYRNADAVFTAIDVGQGQSLCVMSGDKTVVIDCGGNGSLDNAGETSGAYLSTRGRKTIDLLVLTHIHADHANGTENLLEMADVKKIMLPTDPDDEDGLLDEIIEAATRYGVELEYISEKRGFNIDNIRLNIWKPENVGDANERGLIIQVGVDEYDMLVTGDASSSVERKLIEENEISGIDMLVAGHHGSRYSSCGDFLDYIDADTAIISTGYNTYGHPTHEVLARLKAYGYNIYRTDLSGNIEIRLG